MANKLTDLTVEKIAFVDEGDNPEADILIFKKKPEHPPENAGITDNEEGFMRRFSDILAKALGFKGISKSEEDIKKAENSDNSDGKETFGPKKNVKKKGDYMIMKKIDISKLTDEEIRQLEAIEKKALIEEPDDVKEAQAGSDKSNVEKNSGKPEEEDIYKGLHPAVAQELAHLRKRADEAEEKEMLEIAKRYQIIGKKPEELAKTLKSLKAAGGSAFNEMIAMLDESVNMVKNAGVFDEIGKRGEISGGGAEKAWAQIENHAKEIQKAKPDISWEQAVDTAALQHPELVQEYENNI